MTKKYTLTTSEETVTENPEDIIRLMKLAGLTNAQPVAEEEVTEEVRDFANTPGGTDEEQLQLDPTDFEKKTGDGITKQKKSIQPSHGDNPLEYSLDENEIEESLLKEFDKEETEELEEAQSPAQKAAFAKMLAAKKGKKDDTVEENLDKAQEEIDELKEETISEDCGCGHGSDCDCGPECDCGCNAVSETTENNMSEEQAIDEDGADPKPEVGMNFTRVRWANPPMGELEPGDQNEDEYMHGTIIKVSTDHIVVKFFDDTVQKIHVGGIEYDKEENKFYSEENGTSWDTGENDKQDRLAKLAGIQKEEIATAPDPKWDAEVKERRIEGDKARKEDDNNSSIQNFKPINGSADWAKSVTDGTRKHFQTEIEDSSNFEIGSLSSPYTAATYLQEFKRSIDEAFTKHGTPVPERIANIFNKLLEYSKNWPLQMKNRKIGPSTGWGNHMQFADNGDEEYIAELFIEPMLNEFFTAGEEIGMSMDESLDDDQSRLKDLINYQN